MLHDPLANALNSLKLYERTGKNDCKISPASKLIEHTLSVMKDNGYIGSFEKVENSLGGDFTVKLIGKINNCGVIKPRYPVKMDEIEEYEKQYLPAKNVGVLLISTPQGIMTNETAREKKTGGILLAYIY
jgi:small subunit ribosomal protein S8|tara:strand:+ start:2290 stop:2679 length:390 start_codon:yes stop_codon:yes gene_type:complete